MSSTDEQNETGKASRLMRDAILLELQCGRGQADDHATDKLRLIARKLVGKAAEGDIQAIKEVLDRIDGKSVPGRAMSRKVRGRWHSMEGAGRVRDYKPRWAIRRLPRAQRPLRLRRGGMLFKERQS